MDCELRGYGTNVKGKVIRCGGATEGHHLINKSKFSKSPKIKKYIEKHAEVFFADVCSVHNGATKLADTPAARRKLFRGKVKLFGVDYVKSVVDGIPWKLVPHELTYDGIMSAPLP